MPRRSTQVLTIEDLVKSVQEKFGRRALAPAIEIVNTRPSGVVPTGIEPLDRILGGGFPRGLITEVYGPPGSGKTTILLCAIGAVQKANGVAAYIDVELAFAPGWARRWGVDLDKLLLSSPRNGEEALDVAIALIKQGVDLVILDSAPALASDDDLSSAVGERGFATTVRLFNEGLKRIKPLLFDKGTAFVWTNQVRDVMNAMPYGPSTTEPMGWRAKHDAAIRMEVRRREWIKRGDTKIGQVTQVRLTKVKVDNALPHSECCIDILWEGGPDVTQ